jgi:hypothetical protein
MASLFPSGIREGSKAVTVKRSDDDGLLALGFLALGFWLWTFGFG